MGDKKMKLWNYIFLLTGISVLFAFAGLEVAGMSELLRMIGLTTSSSGIGTFGVENTLWNKIFGTAGLLIGVLSGGAIGIGTFIYTKDKAFLMLPLITGVTVYWGSVIVSLVQQKGSYEVFGTVLAIVGIVLSVGFIQSCVDYFMGTD
jgi:hypothetical protein